MWNGLASFLFGDSSANVSAKQELEEELTVKPTKDCGWMIVDRPVSLLDEDEQDEHSCCLELLFREPVVECSPSNATVMSNPLTQPLCIDSATTVVRHVSGTNATHRCVVPHYSARQPCRIGAVPSRQGVLLHRLSRNNTQRANRAYEVQAKCSRQRRFNYDIRNSSHSKRC